MAMVRILSAGAAQAVVEQIAAGFERETGTEVRGDFSAVGAMKWLAASDGVLEMGITQVTEIRANRGVTYVGPLSDGLQMKTVYSAGLATRSESPGAARDFIARLVAPSARSTLAQAGYEFE